MGSSFSIRCNCKCDVVDEQSTFRAIVRRRDYDRVAHHHILHWNGGGDVDWHQQVQAVGVGQGCGNATNETSDSADNSSVARKEFSHDSE